ncbi:hypothetical protein RhiirA4_449296 [Rhizophagus irregularis]|uniref:Uncharacterized protein n=1 Tax=Rhizophagus irregularis TaxID=588596 RepID=A0A2I1HI08_9GLOM|nr:hypothetical protein RhiirA4_449296 [Rhizophagus irregularis]
MAKDKVRRKALTTKQSQNSQEPKNMANTEIVVSEADKIAAKLSAAKSTKASLKQPRRSRQKNKKTDHQTQEVIIIEPNNTLEICDTQDQHDSIDNSDKAAFAALSNAASDTSIIRSSDSSDANIIFYQQLIDGLKRSLEQNKEIFKAIHETKVMHESFQKEVQKKIDDISEKIDQLMIPDDSYWRNLASRICKIQLPLLGLFPDDIEFKKCVEGTLEQEKLGYVERHGSQWIHIYSGRIGPLCHEVIKARRCDKAKDVRSAMFDIFGEKNLTRINTSAGYVEAIKKKAWGKKNTTKKDTAFTLAICEIVLNPKHLKISVSDNALHNRFNIYWNCICNSEEITSSTTKSIRQEELGENYLNTSEESDGNESSGDNLDNNEDSDNSNEDNDDMINENQKRSCEINNIDNQNHKYQRIDNNSLETSFN